MQTPPPGISLKLDAEAASGASQDSNPDKRPSLTMVPSNGTLEPAGQPMKKLALGVTPGAERTPSMIPYNLICQFSIRSDSVTLSATAKFKVYATIEAKPRAVTPVKYFTDTGVGTNSLNKSFLNST